MLLIPFPQRSKPHADSGGMANRHDSQGHFVELLAFYEPAKAPSVDLWALDKNFFFYTDNLPQEQLTFKVCGFLSTLGERGEVSTV